MTVSKTAKCLVIFDSIITSAVYILAIFTMITEIFNPSTTPISIFGYEIPRHVLIIILTAGTLIYSALLSTTAAVVSYETYQTVANNKVNNIRLGSVINNINNELDNEEEYEDDTDNTNEENITGQEADTAEEN